MIKKGLILLLILILSVSSAYAIISEPKDPTLEIRSNTQLTINTKTEPLIVQLTPLSSLKDNLIISENEFVLEANSQKTINLELKKPLESKEYLFINIMYKNPLDDKVEGDNTIIVEVKSTANKQLLLTLKEDVMSEETEAIQLGFSLLPLIVIGLLIIVIYKKKEK